MLFRSGRALLGGSDWQQAVLWPTAIGISALALSLLFPLALRRMRPAEPMPGA